MYLYTSISMQLFDSTNRFCHVKKQARMVNHIDKSDSFNIQRGWETQFRLQYSFATKRHARVNQLSLDLVISNRKIDCWNLQRGSYILGIPNINIRIGIVLLDPF